MQGEREGEQSYESNITRKINQEQDKGNINDLGESDFDRSATPVYLCLGVTYVTVFLCQSYLELLANLMVAYE